MHPYVLEELARERMREDRDARFPGRREPAGREGVRVSLATRLRRFVAMRRRDPAPTPGSSQLPVPVVVWVGTKPRGCARVSR
jgi:hypothetical protein